MASAIKKVEKIRQIVQLKLVMRRWKFLSLRRQHPPVRAGQFSRSDSNPGSTRPVPAGFLAVYIGPEHRRFVIPTRFLNFPVFVSLLKRAEEEFGFPSSGGLVLPCEVDFFRRILESLETNEDRFKGLALDGFLELFSSGFGLDVVLDSSCKEETSASASYCNGFSTPLLQKTWV